MVDRRKSIICLYRDQCPFLRKERRIEKEEKDISNGRGKDGIFTSTKENLVDSPFFLYLLAEGFSPLASIP